jgi:hypothetical protein
VRFALKVVVQNDGDFVDVILHHTKFYFFSKYVVGKRELPYFPNALYLTLCDMSSVELLSRKKIIRFP